jgi:hypothetical protein
MDAAKSVLHNINDPRGNRFGTALSRRAPTGAGRFMKHPSTRAFYQYWDLRRGRSAAPDRNDLAPEGVRELLGDIFVLAYDRDAGFPFRVAGTRLCAFLGRDAKGVGFKELFASSSRAEIEEIVGVVAEETLPAVAGISARGPDGLPVRFELLLLPFSARAHSPLSLTGMLVPMQPVAGRITDLDLVSWRYVANRPGTGPRPLRRWAAARGFMVYEGLR